MHRAQPSLSDTNTMGASTLSSRHAKHARQSTEEEMHHAQPAVCGKDDDGGQHTSADTHNTLQQTRTAHFSRHAQHTADQTHRAQSSVRGKNDDGGQRTF